MSHRHGQPAARDYSRAFAIGVALNVAFVIVEVLYGIAADSMALFADAGHNLSDVLSLLLAWGAAFLAKKAPTDKRTYGFRKTTILASLASAVLLLFALGGITREAVGRLFHPQPVESLTVITVAVIGVVINTITALLFISGRKKDLNIRGAFLHMAADAGVSLGVAMAGVLILTTGWLLIDPLISLLIVAVILAGTWTLLRDSLNLAIDAVPAGIDVGAIRSFFNEIDAVLQVHDLHVWALSTTETALSVHLVVEDAGPGTDFLSRLTRQLQDRFHIDHPTIQIERYSERLCLLDRKACH